MFCRTEQVSAELKVSLFSEFYYSLLRFTGHLSDRLKKFLQDKIKICQFCLSVMHFSPRQPYAESFAYIFIIFVSKRRKEENIFKHTDYLVSWRH